MGIIKPPGGRRNDPPGLDPELAEVMVQTMRAHGVDVAEARSIVRKESEAIALRAELAGPEVSPAVRRDRAIAWAKGEANRLEQLIASYAPSPAAPPSRARKKRPIERPVAHRAARDRFERYRGKLVELGQADADPRQVPAEIWRAAREAATPAGARKALARLPRAIAGPVRRAACGEAGAEQYDLEERRAVVVAAVVIWKLGRRSSLRGCSKVTVGIPRRLIASIVGRALRGRAYEVGSLFATRHRGAGVPTDRRGPRGGLVGDFRRGECGFVVALEQAGALWRRQPPSDVVHPRELGPPRRTEDGRVVQFAFTQYRFPELTRAAAEGAAPSTSPTSGPSGAAPPAGAGPPQ